MWNNIEDNKPKIGIEVKVKTIFGGDDTAIYDGKKWVNKYGDRLGNIDEVTVWSYL
jgi:hypothetical protein